MLNRPVNQKCLGLNWRGKSRLEYHKRMGRSTKRTKCMAKVKMANEALRQRSVSPNERSCCNGAGVNIENRQQVRSLHEGIEKCENEKHSNSVNNHEFLSTGNGHVNGGSKSVRELSTNDEDTSEDQKCNGYSANDSGVYERRTSFGDYIVKKARWLFEPEYFVPEKQGFRSNAKVKDENGR